jgi:hypothetical protein
LIVMTAFAGILYVVALINAQCPLAPGQVLSLQSAALAELAVTT